MGNIGVLNDHEQGLKPPHRSSLRDLWTLGGRQSLFTSFGHHVWNFGSYPWLGKDRKILRPNFNILVDLCDVVFVQPHKTLVLDISPPCGIFHANSTIFIIRKDCGLIL